MIFRHGLFEDDYEAQARVYGYTLGNKADRLQEIGKAYKRAFADGLIDLKEFRQMTGKLDGLLLRNIKPMGRES